MRRSIIYNVLLSLLWSVLLSACIRDRILPCPSLKVMIDIEDKNYDNIDYIESHTGLDFRIDENMSFRSYIQKLTYALYNFETGNVVSIRRLHDVEGDEKMATVHLPENLPFGKYGLVVWGNIESEIGVHADNRFGIYDLHVGGIEGYDVYMSSDELLYDETHHDYVVKLKRLKGKLIIQAVDFPQEIGWSKKEVSGLAGNIDYQFHYSESETVETERQWGRSGRGYVSSTYVSPSLTDGGCTINAQLYDSPDMEVPAIVLDEVSTSIQRNKITLVKYVYDSTDGSVSVYVLIDDAWDGVLDLEKGE